MKFNKDKFKIGTDKNKIIYMDHLITKGGLRPNPRKVEAIGKLKPPMYF